jgi:hypothetical protein
MGEVDGHTFHDVVTSHVNYGPGIAMTKPAMPSLEVGNDVGVQGNGRGRQRRKFCVGDACRPTVEKIESLFGGDRSSNDDFVVLIGNPAAFCVEGDKIIPILGKSMDGNEARAARRDEKYVFEGELMARSDAQVDVSDANSVSGRPVEPLNRVRGNRPQGFKIRTLRRDVVRGTRVEDEWRFLRTSDKGTSGRCCDRGYCDS